MIFEDHSNGNPGTHRQSVVLFMEDGRALIIARGEVAAAEITQPLPGDSRVNVVVHLKSGAELTWGPESLEEAQRTVRLLFGHDDPSDSSEEPPAEMTAGDQ